MRSAGDAPARRGTLAALRSVAPLWLVALLAVLWEVVTRLVRDSFFPPPTRIAHAMYTSWFAGPAGHLFLTDKALDDFSSSLGHMFGGWLIATAAGIALGTVIGLSRTAAGVLDPALQFGRSIPPPTLIPFFVVMFDLGAQMQVATIVFGTVWPVLLNTADGVGGVDRQQLDAARAYRITAARRLLHVTLPAATPKIFAGLRVSLSFALILMVLSELVGSTSGIGSHLIGAQRGSDLPQMWAGIVLLGILGCLFNGVFLLLEHRYLNWRAGARGNR